MMSPARVGSALTQLLQLERLNALAMFDTAAHARWLRPQTMFRQRPHASLLISVASSSDGIPIRFNRASSLACVFALVFSLIALNSHSSSSCLLSIPTTAYPARPPIAAYKTCSPGLEVNRLLTRPSCHNRTPTPNKENPIMFET